jgi:hypothetical protein
VATSAARGASRWVGAAGLVFFVLDVLSFAIASAPEANESDATILDWYTDSTNQWRFIIGAFLAALALTAFVVFITGLRQLLAETRASPLLVELSFTAGLVVAILTLVGIATGSAIAAAFIYSDTFELDPDTARIVLMIGNVWLLAIAGVPGALFVGATCLAARQTGFLPAWLVWVGFAVAVLALAVLLFGANLIPLTLWVLLVSLVLVRRRWLG